MDNVPWHGEFDARQPASFAHALVVVCGTTGSPTLSDVPTPPRTTRPAQTIPQPVGAKDADWIRLLPKAEVHLHLEGCVPLRTVGLCDPSRDGDPPGHHPEAPRFDGLRGFLDFLDRCCALVTSPGQVEAIAYEITRRAAADGAGHVDVIFNPVHWPAWRSSLEQFVRHLDTGFAGGERDHGVTAGLCLSLTRTQPPAESVELVDWLLSSRPPRVVALSVDGDESAAGRTGERFAPLFARARRAGLRTCAHAGESSGPEGVRDAVDLLGVERVDHGIRAVEDPTLVTDLAARAVPLDVCPTSNVELGVVPSLGAHPIEPLRRAGVRVSVNTDDPLLFGVSLAGEYTRCAEAFGWDRQVLAAVARTSIESSFAPEERRHELLEALDRIAAQP